MELLRLSTPGRAVVLDVSGGDLMLRIELNGGTASVVALLEPEDAAQLATTLTEWLGR